MVSRSLLLLGPRDLRWLRHELQPVGDDDILVETRLGAISGGTELPLYRGTSRAGVAVTYPRMTGYESLGIVRERGAAVRGLRVGDRVVATYGHRTHAVIPAARAVAVPAGISDEAALLLILSGDVAHGVRKLGPALREPVLVTGAGTIGLLAVFVLSRLGAPAIDVIEPRPERCDLAMRFGARSASPPEEAALPESAYAGGVECSSRDAAFAFLQNRLRHGGRVCVLADGNIEPLTLAPAFHERELTVIGSSDCPSYHAHAGWYFPEVRRAGHALPLLFDHTVPADELASTFERLATGATTAIKVLIRY